MRRLFPDPAPSGIKILMSSHHSPQRLNFKSTRARFLQWAQKSLTSAFCPAAAIKKPTTDKRRVIDTHVNSFTSANTLQMQETNHVSLLQMEQEPIKSMPYPSAK